MLKQTPLNQTHRDMGARMVDFGGWDMPVNYGSQIEEHHQVRRAAGMFDVCHMLVVDVTGSGIREFLQYLLANNVDKLKEPGKALYSCMLNPSGGVIDDLIVYFMREDWFRIVVNAGTADKDLAWMEQQRAARALKDSDFQRPEGRESSYAPQLTIRPRRDLAMIAVQGPQARDKVWQAIPAARAATESLKPFQAAEFAEYFIGRTGYTGEDGFEIMLPVAEAAGLWKTLNTLGVAPIGLGARDTLRLEAGMNLYGQDMGEDVNPLEAGLAWTVELTGPRDFIGKPALLAKPVKMQMLGLILLDKGVLRGHQKVVTPQGAGEITSGSFSPTLNQSIAFARLPLDVAVGDVVQVEVRDKLLNATVVKLPFARNGKSLI
ncbi:MAG: glycine cleavage system aminomethyltransferase GcvT [Sulfuricella sp.]